MYLELAVIALFTFGYGLLSERIARLPMSGPIVFVLAGVTLGPMGLGWFQSDVEGTRLQHLVDLTLALILFTDAATTNFAVLRRSWQLPARMLGIGLPGAILLGGLLASAIFDVLSLYEAALLGTILAATDAALGKAVIVDERVPAPVRVGLNCESGLNDGLCVPFVLLFIALASGAEAEAPLALFAEEIGIGLAVGLGLAGVGGTLLRLSAARGWVSAVWLQICVPALAAACFAIAQSAHGSGYIAAFAGGMLFGSMAGTRAHQLVMPAEGIGEAMAMLTWLTFGVAVIDKILGALSWQVLGYAALSLTLVRMLPVAAALIGSGTRADSVLFMGWFGPRGLASIVFAILVTNAHLPNGDFVAFVVTCTVGLSLVLHGVTATPLARWIAGRPQGEPETR
jgi:NhaP-type Na+/H+ or K+/H+ antiporter